VYTTDGIKSTLQILTNLLWKLLLFFCGSQLVLVT